MFVWVCMSIGPRCSHTVTLWLPCYILRLYVGHTLMVSEEPWRRQFMLSLCGMIFSRCATHYVAFGFGHVGYVFAFYCQSESTSVSKKCSINIISGINVTRLCQFSVKHEHEIWNDNIGKKELTKRRYMKPFSEHLIFSENAELVKRDRKKLPKKLKKQIHDKSSE